MSDLKAQFRAAREQRESGKAQPNLAQLKALRAQKAAQTQQQQKPCPPAAVAGASAQPPKQQPSVPTAPSKTPTGSSQGLPDDFFEQPAKRQAVVANEPSNKPSPAVPAAPGKKADAALPEGFFADRVADAKARGVKLPDAKDKEDEFQAFQRMMEEELKVVAAKEAEEAEEEAEDKERRDMFEQRLRMERLQKLTQSKSGTGEQLQGEGLTAGTEGAAAEEALGLPSQPPLIAEQPLLLPRRKRVIDTMREIGSALGQGDNLGSEDDDSISEEDLLDWRAKGV